MTQTHLGAHGGGSPVLANVGYTVESLSCYVCSCAAGVPVTTGSFLSVCKNAK